MKKSFAVLLFTACCAFVSCRNNDTGENNDISAIDRVLLECKDEESLVQWTDSTICSSNPDLVLLLDTLYRHSRLEKFFERDTSELDWMRSYQEQICRYYDRHNMGDSQISDYKKVCSVMEYAEKVYDLSDFGGTNLYKYPVSIWSTFWEYAAFIQMQELCEDKKQQKCLFAECEAWKDFEESLLMFLRYFEHIGVTTETRTSYAHIHIAMYDREIHGFDDGGVFLECAEDLFENCCNAILKIRLNADEKESFAESHNRTREIYNEAAEQKEIVLDKAYKWIETRNQWAFAVNSDSCYGEYHRNTSEVLLQLSVMLSHVDLAINEY